MDFRESVDNVPIFLVVWYLWTFFDPVTNWTISAFFSARWPITNQRAQSGVRTENSCKYCKQTAIILFAWLRVNL